MTTRSFALLVNPAAGGGAAPEAAVPVARRLREAGAAVEVTYSPGPHAMEALVAEAVARGDVVVSVGGDGMVASLAGSVARHGGLLGLVPAGRGNDFARMLGVPEDLDGRVGLLLRGDPRTVDLVSWAPPEGGARVVAGSVYAGVDARAAEIVDHSHRLPTSLQYPFAAVRALLAYRPSRYRIDVDGVTSEHLAATVVVANSGFYGKGMRIAPAAEVADGLLDVVVVGAATRRRLLRSLPRIYSGSHVELPEVVLLRGTRVELSADADPAVPVGGDGEPLGHLPGRAAPPAVVAALPGALDVLA